MKTIITTNNNHLVCKHESKAISLSVFTPHTDSEYETGDLFVYFTNGKTYFYPTVRVSTWMGLSQSESVGRYFNDNIRDLTFQNVSDDEGLVNALKEMSDLAVSV
jgi:hypothetical protein